jgi:hypothetical protein
MHMIALWSLNGCVRVSQDQGALILGGFLFYFHRDFLKKKSEFYSEPQKKDLRG